MTSTVHIPTVHIPTTVHGNKTKKIKQPDKTDKKALWANFDKETSAASEAIAEDLVSDGKSKIECVFRSSGERELCECCQSTLAITDEGFFCCTNRACGVIYKYNFSY